MPWVKTAWHDDLIPIVNKSGSAVSTTGWVGFMTIRKKNAAATLVATLTTASGKVTVGLATASGPDNGIQADATASDMNFPAGNYKWDFYRTITGVDYHIVGGGLQMRNRPLTQVTRSTTPYKVTPPDTNEGDVTLSDLAADVLAEIGSKADADSAVITDDLTVDGSTSAIIKISGAAGNLRTIEYRTAGSLRWRVGTQTAAESGANAGTNYSLRAYDDSGTLIGTAMNVTRATLETNLSSLTLDTPLAIAEGGTGAATAAGATAALDVFTSGLKGLAPASGGGTSNYLRADGTWAAPAAGGLSDGDKGDITVSGSGATWTIDDGAVGNSKLADMANNRIKGNVSGSTGPPSNLTASDVKTMLAIANTDVSGLGTLSTQNGTFANAVIGPGSATDNAAVRYDSTTGKLVQDSEVILNDDKSVTLSSVASDPSAPAADKVTLFSRTQTGRALLAARNATDAVFNVQRSFGQGRWASHVCGFSQTGPHFNGIIGPTAVGTGTAATWASTNRFTQEQRVEYLVTTPSTSAVAGYRTGSGTNIYHRGANAGQGGFYYSTRWGPATGVTISTHRAFVGLIPSYTPTDVDPSTLVNLLGMGWDDDDTNVQFIHNDGSGTAAKIDTGIAVPSADRTTLYDFEMYCAPNGGTVYFRLVEINTGTVFSSSAGSNLPGSTTALSPHGYLSVGGSSSVIGFAHMSLHIETV